MPYLQKYTHDRLRLDNNGGEWLQNFTNTIVNSVISAFIVMAQAITSTGQDDNELDILRPQSVSIVTFRDLKFCVTVPSSI